MKNFIVLLAMVLLAVASSTPALAKQTQPAKGTEGPDVRKSGQKQAQ
jgi:hypothetical protein